tara:strand:- start:67 stop:303 length:237 start_codon:yes stop_codon:yes gene_type:complete
MIKEIESLTENDIRAGETVLVKDIDWDIDWDESPEDVGLSSNMIITLPDNWQPGDSIADALSDKHGFCIHSVGRISHF